MFKKEFFEGNRKRLASKLPNSLIFVTAHSQLQESADLAYQFRQDSSFWYLTGLKIPDTVLVIDTKEGESTLFLPDQNDYQKEWDGEIDDVNLTKISGIRELRVNSELTRSLKQGLKKGIEICYLAPLAEIVEPYNFYSNPARRRLENEIKKVAKNPKDVRVELARLRQVKQAEEIEAIEKAISITAQTLADVKSKLQNFKTEKEIENAISAGFYARGSEGHAYAPIIAAGKNAATIHYSENSAELLKNQMVLLDVGAKVNGYASDISRTWIFGAPSERQKAIHCAVLELQEIAFSILKPGVVIKEYQEEMEKHASLAIKKLGLAERKFPHGFSHFLGLDVHDAGDYNAPLQPGCVLTVEPGIYLADESIGVRIEDNVLITKNGIKNLSSAIPRNL